MRTRSLLPLTLAAAALGACSSMYEGRDYDRRYDDDLRRSAEVSGPRGESLRLLAPGDQAFRRGETRTVRIAVDRNDVDGPLELRITGLPKGVEIVEEDVRIPADREFADVTFHTERDADLVSGHAVRVTANAPDGKGVSAHFRVSVRAN